MNHHPVRSLLVEFCRGELDGGLSAVVATHVQRCQDCLDMAEELEASLAAELFSDSEDLGKSSGNDWKSILSQIETLEKPVAQKHLQLIKVVEVNKQKFTLPHSLQSIDLAKIKWMPFGKGGQISRLQGDLHSSLLLIYLAPNEEVPLHSHTGNEYSCVISGSFSAAGLNFSTGDFSFSNQDVLHAPKATSPEGCLLLSKVESRLNFLHGFLAPLNAIFWRFLDWKLNRL